MLSNYLYPAEVELLFDSIFDNLDDQSFEEIFGNISDSDLLKLFNGGSIKLASDKVHEDVLKEDVRWDLDVSFSITLAGDKVTGEFDVKGDITYVIKNSIGYKAEIKALSESFGQVITASVTDNLGSNFTVITNTPSDWSLDSTNTYNGILVHDASGTYQNNKADLVKIEFNQYVTKEVYSSGSYIEQAISGSADAWHNSVVGDAYTQNNNHGLYKTEEGFFVIDSNGLSDKDDITDIAVARH